MKSKKTLSFFLIISCAALVYWPNQKSEAPELEVFEDKQASVIEAGRPSRMISGVSDRIPDEVKVFEKNIDSVMEKVLSPELDSRLKASTVLSKRIKRIALMVRHAREADPEIRKKLALQYRDYFVQNKEETVAQVREYLDALNSIEFAHEHFGLLSVLAILPDNKDIVKEIALKESTTMIAPKRPENLDPLASEEIKDEALSWKVEHMLPLSTHNAFVKVTLDSPKEALSGTMDAIRGQQDTKVRQAIASMTLGAHPGLKDDLMNFLADEKINLGDITPADPSLPPGLTVKEEAKMDDSSV